MSDNSAYAPVSAHDLEFEDPVSKATTSAQKPSFLASTAFRKRLLVTLLSLLLLWAFIPGPFKLPRLRDCFKQDKHPNGHPMTHKKNATKVALEAHVMSKCPDAKDCLRELVVPAMEKIHDMVEFKLSFIGTVDPDSDAIDCKHGPAECLGNMIILCAAKEYPDPKIHLGFANCMISDYSHVPEEGLVKSCAMEHGMDFSSINNCISDEGEGIDLLRKSVERSEEAHVTKSCTVRLNDEVRCIRDGGEWYDCPGGSSVKNLVHDVEKLYKKSCN